jgi:hypothetical protein
MIWNLIYGLHPMLAVGLVLILALAVGLVIRRFIGRTFSSSERHAHNELLGHAAGITGVINAVLLAFIVYAAWTGYDRARDVVSEEVSLLNDIWRDAEAASSAHDSLVSELQSYLVTVIDTEWPHMQHGMFTERQGAGGFGTGWRTLGRAYTLSLNLEAGNALQKTVAEELVKRFNSLFDARRQRIASSTQGALTATVWGVVLAGGLVSIICCGLFGFESRRLHTVSVMLVALSFGLVFYLIISLQWPFRGQNQISAEPYCAAWNNLIRLESREAAERGVPWVAPSKPVHCLTR